MLLLLTLEWLLDHLDKLSQSSKQVPEAEAPALDAHGIDEEIDQKPVTEDKDQEDPKVSPLLARLDVQCRKVLVANAVLAVLAVAVRMGFEQVAAGRAGELAGILGACLSWRRVEVRRLGWCALHGNAIESGGKDTSDPVQS